MKTISKIFASITMLFGIISTNAQTVPTPPKTPTTTHSVSHSIDGSSQSSTVSVSISNSDDSYSLNAKFPSNKQKEIKDVLMKELNSNNMTTSNNRYLWKSTSGKDEVYNVSLNDKRLSMYLDKEIASSSLEEKFENLGATIRTVIVGKQNEVRREAERIQREADRIKRDADRMQKEAKRMQREADRHAANISRQYKDDAKRIADEARRLAEEASGLNVEAAHKGAVKSVVRQLLGDSKTIYNETTKSGFNWTWPDAQKELLSAFKNDNLINTENDVVFIKDETGIHVNGKHLSKNEVAKYNTILAKNKISKTTYFTFYKTYKHIVIVDDRPNLEGFINDAMSKSILDSSSKEIKLALNGNTAYKNGNQLSTNSLSALNSILLKNKIIPAPGKHFEIIKKGTKVGYSIGEKRHLGTWQMNH